MINSDQTMMFTPRLKEEIAVGDILGIVAGCFILALGVQSILVPVRLLHGGIAGIAIVLNFLTRIDIWLWYLLLNVPIFIAGFKMVSRRFFIYSLIGMGGLSLFLALLEPYHFSVHDVLLDALLGGVIAGLGSGLIFKCKGSSGGLDIIAIILRRYRGYNIGQTYFLINILILAASLVVSNLKLTLYSAIAIYVSARVVDAVQAGLHVKRTVFIISEQWEEIAAAVIHSLHRGCTYLSAHGAYSNREEQIIMTTVGKTELPRLKEIIFGIDPAAFIMIHETIEVFGKGFKTRNSEF